MNALENEYLNKQLIAYIGNKRKLLPLIKKSIDKFYPNQKGIKFADIFAGSGAVSRLAKSLDFQVFSNDWEEYSYIINKCYILINKSDLNKLFKNGIETELERLNNLPNPKKSEEYMAKYYAPKNLDIDKADYNSERLFYTRSNALIIDKIRNEIEKKYPANSKSKNIQAKREILISILLYQAATHTNTSGVFKAFHKGFGGHNKDALKRILSPIVMELPILADNNYKNYVFREDAKTLVKKKELQKLDIAYLDPPYNQHQYGSNYHILNTIAKWDKIPMKLEKDDKGKLKSKAGIRKDWVDTRSLYCYKKYATEEFEELIENIDAKHILISYSTDGIIPFEKMKEICQKKGRISIITNEYTKYRGGRQSNKSVKQNIEFIIAIETQKKSLTKDIQKFDKQIELTKLKLLFDKSYSPEKLKKEFTTIENYITTRIDKKTIRMKTTLLFKIEELETEELKNLSLKETLTLKEKLNRAVCISKEEEINTILKIIKENPEKSHLLVKDIPTAFKKLVHKKYSKIYYELLHQIKDLEKENKELYKKINKKIDAIEILAEKRFRG